jgi:multidrug efflux system outer membrane protein
LHRPRVARAIQFGAAAIALAALSACSVGPAYHHPDVAAPTAWPTSLDDQASTDRWPSTDWWREFNSPQLNELIEQAQHTNDDIASAIARIREADAQARIAGANLLPDVDLSGDATRGRQRSTLTSTPINANSFSAEVGASYELDFWGKNRAIRDAAVMAANASRYDRATVELTVMTQVAVNYFQAIATRDRLNVAEQNLASAQRVLRGLQLEQTVGTANALDVAQQETAVAVQNAAIPPLRQQLQQTLDALAILVGKTPDALELPSATLADFATPEVQSGIPSGLLARRPDVASAEAQLRSANADIVAARAAFFPSIALTADGGYASNALSTLFNPVSRVFALTGSIAQPIFHGGALSGEYSYRKARYDELLANYHKTAISAFSNVEDALIALQQSGEQQQRQQEAADKARRAYQITQTQFRAGTINILTVLNTQNALFTAEDNLVQVRFSHLQSLVGLFNALGGGWKNQEP